MQTIILVLVALAVGFIVGALVLRNNSKAANAKINQLQADKDKIASDLTAAKAVVVGIKQAATKDLDSVKDALSKAKL